jgi:hypothetical protein
MTIKLNIHENNFIKLCLFSGKREIDCLEWQDENDLSHTLLANLDKILRKNETGLDKIVNYHIISEVPQKWTTYRIADIALKTLKIGTKESRLAKKKTLC